MKKLFNEGNQIHNFMSSSGSGTVINYGSGSGSDFLTSYGSGSDSVSTSKKVTVPTYGSGSATLVSSGSMPGWSGLSVGKIPRLCYFLYESVRQLENVHSGSHCESTSFL